MITRTKLKKILKDHNLGTEHLKEFPAKKVDFPEFEKNNDFQKNETALINFQKLDIFHQAVAPILALAQFLSIMPVVGVMRLNPKHLRFTLRCPQTAWTILIFFSGMLLIVANIRKVFRIGIDAKNIVAVMFFVNVLCANFLFLLLARRWPKLIQYWFKVEMIFLKEPYTPPKQNLASRIQRAAIIIIFLSAVEHGLFFLSHIYGYAKQVQICNTPQKASFHDYMKNAYDYLFSLIPYSITIGVLTLIINAILTFTWNYMDLFIMMVSKGIAYRFEQITMRIKGMSDKDIGEDVFSEVREHYVQLCELLEYVDENLSGIILLSCINNLYFICSQLLNIFNKLRWPVNYIYFWYSLLYLIGRTAFVFLSAASINDESRAPIRVLRRISKKNWCVEVERLLFEMNTQTVALSGKKFYYLTRKLLFGMAGTIVTYELVLLQFDEQNRSKGLPELCH